MNSVFTLIITFVNGLPAIRTLVFLGFIWMLTSIIWASFVFCYPMSPVNDLFACIACAVFPLMRALADFCATC